MKVENKLQTLNKKRRHQELCFWESKNQRNMNRCVHNFNLLADSLFRCSAERLRQICTFRVRFSQSPRLPAAPASGDSAKEEVKKDIIARSGVAGWLPEAIP